MTKHPIPAKAAVTLAIAPSNAPALKGAGGVVVSAERFGKAANATLYFYTLEMDDGTILPDVPQTCVVRASRPLPERSPRSSSTRRPALKMRIVPDDRSEADKQAEVVGFLEGLGYVVKQSDTNRAIARCTTHRFLRAFCPFLLPNGQKCGKPMYTLTTGADSGIADLLVSHPRWPGGVWAMIEMKKNATAEIKPEQARLAGLGLSHIVWSLAMACEAIADVERAIGVDSLEAVFHRLAAPLQGVQPFGDQATHE